MFSTHIHGCWYLLGHLTPDEEEDGLRKFQPQQRCVCDVRCWHPEPVSHRSDEPTCMSDRSVPQKSCMSLERAGKWKARRAALSTSPKCHQQTQYCWWDRPTDSHTANNTLSRLFNPPTRPTLHHFPQDRPKKKKRWGSEVCLTHVFKWAAILTLPLSEKWNPKKRAGGTVCLASDNAVSFKSTLHIHSCRHTEGVKKEE